jgi:membrane fusion protein (multidrug efflux system)
MMRPSRRPPLRRAITLVLSSLAAALPLAMAGCKKPVAAAMPPPPMVGVFESRKMSVPVVASPTGTTRALEEVIIRARVYGFLTERHFEEGAMVKKGQLLFVIDEKPYQVALESADARLAEANAALAKAEQSKGREIADSQLALDRAQSLLAQIQERRSQSLLARNAGSQEDFDKAEAERKRWEAQVKADLANAAQAKADYDVGIAAAKAQVAAATAAKDDAQLNLDYCRMYAPINGRIGAATVKVGNVVGPNVLGGGYSELATINQLDPIGIEIRASSRFLDQTARLVRDRLAVQIFRTGPAGKIAHPDAGECYFLDNAIDETSSTFLVKARVPNPEGALLPGEYVDLKMVVDQIDDAVVVPEVAVIESEAGTIVYVVDGEGKVAIQRVEAAHVHDGYRVITGGLAPGTPVIVQGLQLIRPGVPVKAEPAVLPKSVGEGSSGNKGESASQKPGARGAEPEKAASRAKRKDVVASWH